MQHMLVWLIVLTAPNPSEALTDRACAVVKASRQSRQRVCELRGRVKFVDAFPDYRIEFVDAFADARVRYVEHFPNKPGRWKVVEHFPDFTVEVVEHFPDFTVEVVEHFPGCR